MYDTNKTNPSKVVGMSYNTRTRFNLTNPHPNANANLDRLGMFSEHSSIEEFCGHHY